MLVFLEDMAFLQVAPYAAKHDKMRMLRLMKQNAITYISTNVLLLSC